MIIIPSSVRRPVISGKYPHRIVKMLQNFGEYHAIKSLAGYSFVCFFEIRIGDLNPFGLSAGTDDRVQGNGNHLMPLLNQSFLCCTPSAAN